jgi:glycosyltransferase involved in cell wall biosynthesis
MTQRIGIDIQSTAFESTGIGYYTQNLIKEYEKVNDIDFFYYKKSKKSRLNTIDRLWWENFSLTSRAKKDRVDILHVPGFAGPYFKGNFKKVTTVHDLIGLIYPKNLACISRFYWQKWLPACIKNSDFIIADSENTKKDIISFLGFNEKLIEVVSLASDERFSYREDKPACRQKLKESCGISSDFFLSVSTIEPRKNFITLIKAFNACPKSIKERYKVVIVGKKAWGLEELKNTINELGLSEKIILLDYIDIEILILLYNCATAFVFPSMYEGFGLPVLEALSCGLSVIASNTSSIPEITKDAALLCDPCDIDSFRKCMIDVAESEQLRTDLSHKGLQRAKDFSWKKTAEKTLDIYKRVYEGY